MEPETNTPDPYDYNPADAGTDRPERARDEQPSAGCEGAGAKPATIHGIAGILDCIPRDVPSGMWATVRIPESEVEHGAMSEVGVVITRETLVTALDAAKVKMSANDLDALVAATGYALSAVAAHLIVGSVMFAKSRSQMPSEVENAFAMTSQRMGQIDNRLSPVFRLMEKITTNGAEPSDERASHTRSEIMAGSAILGSLVRMDPSLVSLGSVIALAMAKNLINANNGEEGESNG